MSAYRRMLVDAWGRLIGFEPGEFRASGRFYATGPIVPPDRVPESRPALPPLPVIEQWAIATPNGPVTYYGNDPQDWEGWKELCHTHRLFRLEAVEEVTPTPELVRVTLNDVVWEREPAGGWSRIDDLLGRVHYADPGSYLADALDRIVEMEAGR